MQQDQPELRIKIRRITFKFAIVGWIVAALMMGLIVDSQGNHSFFYLVKSFAVVAGCMAAISLIPLAASTILASRLMSWIVCSEEHLLSLRGKIYYGAFLTILISVGGAGVLVVSGVGIYSGLFSGHKLSTFSFSEIPLMLFLGAGYPLVFGVWLEIPMLFFYSHLIKKLVLGHGKIQLEKL